MNYQSLVTYYLAENESEPKENDSEAKVVSLPSFSLFLLQENNGENTSKNENDGVFLFIIYIYLYICGKIL